jgi:glutamate-1-semialdehyde 2,1-aminomutase
MTARVLTGYRSAYPTEEERARLGRLCGYLLDNGILIATTGMGALSTPMVEADIDRLIEGVRAGLATLGPAA